MLTLVAEVRNDETNEVVARAEFCGTPHSGSACPVAPPSPVVVERSQSISLPGAPNGAYTVIATGCDGAGQCRIGARRFYLGVAPPAETRQVRVSRVEVNQGVQSVLSGVEGPGSITPLSTGVSLVPGKFAAIRYYLLGVGGSATNYAASLALRGERRDGSTFTRRIAPNAGGPITVAPEPSTGDRDKTLLAMRADLSSTLNFVLPASVLDNVRFLDFRLREADGDFLSGWSQARFGPPVRLGINAIRLVGPAVPSGSRPPGPVNPDITDYLDVAYPITESRVLSERTLIVMEEVFQQLVMSECSYLLLNLWRAYGGDDTPVRRFTSDPSWITTLGIIPFNAVSDAAGCAYRPDDRIGGSSVSETWGDVAAQEIAHNMGLRHASNSHDESEGGEAETDWPAPHGTIGDRSFGLIPQLQTPPSGTDLGQWTLKIVDPCPLPIDDKYPTCPINSDNDGQMAHDFMSYGSSDHDLSPLKAAVGAWVSPRTYNRIYSRICGGTCEVASRTSVSGGGSAAAQRPAVDERVDSFLVDGVLMGNGTIDFFPLLRKPMPASALEEAQGPYSLELRDATGGVLYEEQVDVVEVTGSGGTHRRMIHEVVPFRDDVASLVVENAGMVVGTMVATANVPTVRITDPSAAQTLAAGTHVIRWEASDLDGDALTSLVQYSPDGGFSWQGIALVPSGNPLEAELRVDEMIPGRYGMIRVTVSDGLNTSVAETPFFVSVGTAEAPATDATVSRALSLRLAKHLVIRGRLSAPGGPFSCIEGARVVIKRGKKTVATAFTRATGRFRVKVADRRGTYRATAPAAERAALTCAKATSRPGRHRH